MGILLQIKHVDGYGEVVVTEILDRFGKGKGFYLVWKSRYSRQVWRSESTALKALKAGLVEWLPSPSHFCT